MRSVATPAIPRVCLADSCRDTATGKRRHFAVATQLVAVGLAMYVIEVLCLKIGLPGTTVSPVYLASGVGLAAVLLAGWRTLVPIYVVSVLASLTVGTPLLVSLVLNVASVIELVIAGAALMHFCGRRCDLLRIRDAAVLLVFGAGLAAGAAAVFGTVVLQVAFDLGWSAFVTNWTTWWLGDLAGLILVTPLIMSFVTLRPRRPEVRHVVEAGFLLAVIAAVGYVAFTGLINVYSATPAQYIIFTLLMWTAFRFGPCLTMVSTNILALIAIAAAVHMRGPFILPTLNDTLLFFQASMSVLGVAALILATVVNERREALRAVVEARDGLEETVRRRTAQLEELATHDALTGLFNRRAFADHLERAVSQARRDREASLLFVDVDTFKAFNDSRGHAFGDTVLKTVARALTLEARKNDIVARLGGDEFVVLLDGSDVAEAHTVGERIRLRAEELGRPLGAAISLSGGTASVDGLLDAEGVMKAVDDSMYVAKAAGRGRVIMGAPRVSGGAGG